MNREDLDAIRVQLNNKKIALERAKAINDKYIQVQSDIARLQLLQDQCYKHRIKLEQLTKILEKEDASFRTRRINFLNDHVTEELLKIFPSKGFKAKIDCDFKRGSGLATLYLIDKNNVERSPDITEGKLCQYLISFASTVGAIKSLQASNIYIDEAFGVSSTENLPKIGEMLLDTVKDGTQLILISQKADLYSEISHREIHLELNEAEDTARVVKVEDF